MEGNKGEKRGKEGGRMVRWSQRVQRSQVFVPMRQSVFLYERPETLLLLLESKTFKTFFCHTAHRRHTLVITIRNTEKKVKDKGSILKAAILKI